MKVINGSGAEAIVIYVVPSGFPDAQGTRVDLPPHAQKTVNAPCGCMSLTVATPEGAEKWKGVVPSITDKPLVISPEEGSVKHDGVSLPECKKCDSPLNKRRMWIWIFVAAIVVGTAVYFLWFRKPSNSKSLRQRRRHLAPKRTR